MTEELPQQLATWAGRHAVGSEVAGMIRSRGFDKAERFLLDRLTAYTGPIATACRGVPDGHVRIEGWDQLDADLAELCAVGREATALGLDLSNYSDAPGAAWWDKDPVVEVTPFSDDVFPFSASRRQDLLDRNESYPAPWTGEGPVANGRVLTVHGLRALNGALLRRASEHPWRPNDGGPIAEESVAEYLGWWWLHLRFQQAVHRDLDERGLAVAVPVLVGTHDVGPWLQTVHLVGRVSDHAESTRRILDERAEHETERRRAQAEETVKELRDLRSKLRAFGWFHRSAERTETEQYAATKVAMACQAAALVAPGRSIGRMSNREFEQLMAALVSPDPRR